MGRQLAFMRTRFGTLSYFMPTASALVVSSPQLKPLLSASLAGHRSPSRRPPAAQRTVRPGTTQHGTRRPTAQHTGAQQRRT
ncbi:Protein of unknown function [Gryllus bimaculatus]|nr:Protein of unknown function [Gryllus bimaculatus]